MECFLNTFSDSGKSRRRLCPGGPFQERQQEHQGVDRASPERYLQVLGT